MEDKQINQEEEENFVFEDHDQGTNALNLKFTIGFSSDRVGAVHNLSLEDRKSNLITGCCVAYDHEMKKRWIVTADSGKNSMIVIWDADQAIPYRSIFKLPPDDIVSIDMSKNCNFIATLSNKTQIMNGVSQVISQKVTIWEWKYKTEQIFIADFSDKDGEIYSLLRFNPNSTGADLEILINGKKNILFWNINPTDPSACRPYFPLKSKGDKKQGGASSGNSVTLNSKQKLVEYTQSTFLNKATMAVTATTGGYVIVWDICEALCKENEVKTDRRKIKTVQLLNNKKETSDKDIINFLINYNDYIVIGSGDGAIKFYDYKFIIVRWFENVCWLVTSISFDMSNNEDNKSQLSYLNEQKEEESANTNKFKCIPFITSDISATIKRVYNTKTQMIDYSDENIKYEEIYRGVENHITSVALHPHQQMLVFGTDAESRFKKEKAKNPKESILREKRFEFKPYIQLLYYPDHMKAIKEENLKMEDEIKKRKKHEGNKGKDRDDFDKDKDKYVNPYKRYLDSAPTVIEYSQDGKYLMVGTRDEKILVLHPENLSINLGSTLQIKDITDQNQQASILEIIFSQDEKHFAATDDFGRIGLFRNENPYSNSNSEKKEWTLVARHHFKGGKINSFCFSDRGHKLYCVCQDKHLYEFDVVPNSIYENYQLVINRFLKVENECNMNSVIWYPISTGNDRNIVIANDDYKMRTVMVHSNPGSKVEDNRMIIKQTCLGPAYGGPIQKLRVIPGYDKDKRMLAFSTGYKIIGLILLPIDGNPYKFMGVIGHPNEIKDIKPAKNLDYIITTGGKDFTINGWKYNINPLLESVASGGDGIDPFLTLLEGGRDGLMYQDMIDFFYYAQIKSKDENTTKFRVLNDTVPIRYIHGLLASMGFYPSKADLENITNEVRYSKFSESAKTIEYINFDMFVKLYINHRPYRDLEVSKIQSSFDRLKSIYISHLSSKEKELNTNSNNSTINMLKNLDGIPRDVFISLLKDHGDGMEDKEISECLEVLRGDSNVKNLPEVITFQYLFNEVLRFEEVPENEENINAHK